MRFPKGFERSLCFDKERPAVVLAWADWLRKIAPFDFYGTLTFELERSGENAFRYFRSFMGRELSSVSWFGAAERNPDLAGNNPGYHIHFVGCDAKIKRTAMYDLWHERFGNARILPIIERRVKVPHTWTTADGRVTEGYDFDGDEGMTLNEYVSKYVLKERAFYDLSLTDWRRDAVNFLLR